MKLPVLGLADLKEQGSRSVPLPDGTQAFVLRHQGALHAYLNRCPHWGVDLDYGFGDFVDKRVGRVVCRNHAAEFECDTGLCVKGPCVGKSLERVTLVEDADGHALVIEGVE